MLDVFTNISDVKITLAVYPWMSFYAYEYETSIRCIKKIAGNCTQKKNMNRTVIMLFLLPVLIYANHLEIQSLSYLQDVFKRRSNSAMSTYIKYSLFTYALQSVALSVIDYLFAQVYMTSFESSLSEYIKMPFDIFKTHSLGQLTNRQYEKGEASAKIVYIIFLHTLENLFKIASVLYELQKKSNKHLIYGLALGVLMHFVAFFLFSKEHNHYQKHYIKAKVHACSIVEGESANFDIIKTSSLGEKSVGRISSAMENRRRRRVAFDSFRHKTRLAYKSFEVFCVVFFYSFYYRGVVEAANLAGMVKQIISLYESLRELLRSLSDANSFFFTFYMLESRMVAPKERREVLGEFDSMEVVGLAFQNVFSGVSMTVLRNEKVAVVGRNGAGKTVLLRALSGLSEYSGDVRINGVPLDAIDRGSLYRCMTVVSQTDSYTSGSIMKNLQYGNSLSREEVVERCKEFGVDEVFEGLENGYDKFSGSCGRELSGGQRQRVNFMRGVLRSTPVLIMDDCLSGVSTHSRVMLLSKLLETRDRTLIVSTYNTDLLPRFDKILLLDGSSSKFGTFDELKDDIRRYAMQNIAVPQ